jgi:predicted transcriptional regulator
MKEEKIIKILEKKNRGYSITELVNISKLSRSAIRTSIAKLEGANRISFRNIGMAKVYFLNQKRGRK